MQRLLLWFFARSTCFIASSQLLRIPLEVKPKPPTDRLDNTFLTSNFSVYPKRLHVLLKNRENLEYFGRVGMGTPTQYFHVIFDTGSANSWLPSSNCPQSNVACQRHSRYHASKSSSHVRNGRNFTLAYGAGAVSGYLSQDTLQLEGVKLPGLIFGQVLLQHQTVFNSVTFDGIVGLGLSGIAWPKTTPFIELLCQLDLVDQCVFSVFLRRAPGKLLGGEIIFGGIIDSHYNGSLHYVPIISNGYWKFQISRVSVGKQQIDGQVNAILDTGTSLILMPERSYDSLHLFLGAKLKGGHYTLTCQLDILPDIRLLIGGVEFAITPDDYVVKVRNSAGESLCVTSLVPILMNFWVLGDVFLVRHYTVYDVKNKRIGLAKAKPFADFRSVERNV